jgi:hypothetical protein
MQRQELTKPFTFAIFVLSDVDIGTYLTERLIAGAWKFHTRVSEKSRSNDWWRFRPGHASAGKL